MTRPPALIRCDVPGCSALVEPHIARCGWCRKAHGPSPDSRPDPDVKQAKPKHRCAGLRGVACSALIAARYERCLECERQFKRLRAESAAGIPHHTHRSPRPNREDTK